MKLSGFHFLAILCVLIIKVSAQTDLFDESARCVRRCSGTYNGDLDTTVNGNKCRQWRADDVSGIFGEADLDEMADKCRNPDFKPMPYCFVSDTQWEFCFASKCQDSTVSTNCGVPGFYRMGDNCYSAPPTTIHNRTAAFLECRRASSRLAQFQSSDEMAFFSSLTCLPVYLSARKRRGTWEWKRNSINQWGISRSLSTWPWCNGFPTSVIDHDCLIMMANRCLQNVACVTTEDYYPACRMGTENAKYIIRDLGANLTWSSAVQECNTKNTRLCSFSQLCDDERNFTTGELPLSMDQWIPISDEYNDWVYAGPQPHDRCRRHTHSIGPGINSNRGTLFCCKKQQANDTVRLPEPQSVTVYVRSAVIQSQVYYKYSRFQENTIQDIKTDEVSWLSIARKAGDVTSFTLASHYKKNVFQSAIFFCKKSSIINGLETKSYTITRTQCQEPFALDFYLYGPSELTPNNGRQLNVVYDDSGHAKVSSELSTCCGYRHVAPFQIYTNSTGASGNVDLVDPCSSVLKLRDARGVISSPNFPQPYNQPPSSKCRWRIIAPQNSTIRINFTNIHLQNGGPQHQLHVVAQPGERFRSNQGLQFNHRQQCPTEAIEIRTPSGRFNTDRWFHYGTFCGDRRPPSFMTISNVILVELSNIASTGSSTGFLLKYEILDPPSGFERLTAVSSEPYPTWQSSRNQCLGLGKDLCLSSDICRYSNRPFYGVDVGNEYSPVLDEYNNWLQVGDHLGQTCQLHNALFGPPIWGIVSEPCENGQVSCPQNRTVYCCDQAVDAELRAPALVTVRVFTLSYNGQVFNRYIREGIDAAPENENAVTWSNVKVMPEDTSVFQLYSTYSSSHNKVIYFCFQQLISTIGPLTRVYTMADRPCTDGWRLQFYLYGASQNSPGSRSLYVGIYQGRPGYSRLSYNLYLPGYTASSSFVAYGYSNEPDVTTTTTAPTIVGPPNYIERCTIEPLHVTSPATIVSPNYPDRYNDNQRCAWLVRLSSADMALEGSKLKLTILDMSIERVSNCVNDRLEIYTADYDARSDSIVNETYVRRHCGNNLGNDLIIRNSFLLRFITDFSLTMRGFRIKIETVRESCGGSITENGVGVTSPGYPIAYTGGLNCVWSIQAPNAGYSIEIQFTKLQLIYSDNCTLDVVRVASPGLDDYVFCGVVNQPPRLQLDTSVASILFETSERASGDPTDKGFTATIYFIPRAGTGTCGVPDVLPWGAGGAAQDRILGGLEAVAGSWPWVAMIDGATCGGVLLNERWVLTAGHCLVARGTRNQDFTNYNPDVSRLTVIIGRHRRDAPSPAIEQTSRIDRVVVHPRYARLRPRNARVSFGTETVPYNDITLLRLATPTRVSSTVKPICLPDSDVTVGEQCVVAGWGSQGSISVPNQDRGALRYARIPILENSLCNSWPALAGAVGDNNICAGFPDGGIDSCKGDSGGPLMCQGPDGSYSVKGIVSWGKGCGVARQPGVYTRVWSYYHWITSHIFEEP